MVDFAKFLQRVVLTHPVIDKTALSGRYDFDLEWTPSGAHDIFGSIQQLGLKLESTKAPVDVLVIDRVEKPEEN